MDMDISIKPLKEVLILIMGPLVQIIVYLILNQIGFHNSLLKYYHFGILLFNLLPIMPLDGGRLLNIVLCNFIPYKKTLYLSIIISYIIAIIILFSNSQLSINMIITYIVLIILIHKEELKINIHFHKFVLERLLKNYKFNKTKYINNEKKMYRYRNNMFKNNYKCIEEKEYLRQKYLT